jgi:hypothetical protein
MFAVVETTLRSSVAGAAPIVSSRAATASACPPTSRTVAGFSDQPEAGQVGTYTEREPSRRAVGIR